MQTILGLVNTFYFVLLYKWAIRKHSLMWLILLPRKQLFTCALRINWSGNSRKFAGKKSVLESIFSKAMQAATLLKKDSITVFSKKL